MRFLFILWCLSFCFAGCKSIKKIEYYEPKRETEKYCIPKTSDSPGKGPIKRVEYDGGVFSTWFQSSDISYSEIEVISR